MFKKVSYNVSMCNSKANYYVSSYLCRLYAIIMIALGYLLSPLSFWNDLYVNIPLAYLMSTGFQKIINLPLVILFPVFYVITNIIGILIFQYYVLKGFKYKFDVKKIVKIEKALAIISLLIVIALFFLGYIDIPKFTP